MRRAIIIASDRLSVAEPRILWAIAGMSQMLIEVCVWMRRVEKESAGRPRGSDAATYDVDQPAFSSRVSCPTICSAAFPSHLGGITPFFHCPAITRRPHVTVNRFSASEGGTTQVPSGSR